MATGGLNLAGAAVTALLVCGTAAAADSLEVCVDYGCDKKRQVRLNHEERAHLFSLFGSNPDAAAERRNAAHAVSQLERIVGVRAGTAQDAPRNTALHGRAGQLDCVAESINTLTYLGWLDKAGLLSHHRLAGREMRRRWLFAIHWTAVLEESATGARYAIDSWYGANGDLPMVLPITEWRRGELPSHALR